jgi:uncharacterized protein YggE
MIELLRHEITAFKENKDMAILSLGVTTQNMQLKIARQENAEAINKVINTLKEMGISLKDIQTQTFIINPRYDYIEGKQVFKGYEVIHTLGITVHDINKIGEIIDNAVESGANQVSGITFSISDPSIIYQKALEASVEDALMKVKTLGDKLGVTVSRVPVYMLEKSCEAITPKVAFALQTVGTGTQVQPGQIEVNATIEAIFEYIIVQRSVQAI